MSPRRAPLRWNTNDNVEPKVSPAPIYPLVEQLKHVELREVFQVLARAKTAQLIGREGGFGRLSIERDFQVWQDQWKEERALDMGPLEWDKFKGEFLDYFFPLEIWEAKVKEFINLRKRELKLDIDDWVYLKISPMKGVMRFVKRVKLSSRYVGPHKILRCFGKIAYELDLSSNLALVHPVFHVSLLKKFIGDPTSIVPLERVSVNESLSYEEVPVQILDCQV
ncbi:hypothetical protein MTR67_040247 [Solanum verrucosum]|uniref:Tf2-1-like SH3-like domain-containing protein n=1 Tax=Solanum verrucosum TaxID=315347 RepID=A0AAF0ZP97_SOLVR|nr:hypothetical protein MTR67_040247 [Solanum verrucosum]